MLLYYEMMNLLSYSMFPLALATLAALSVATLFLAVRYSRLARKPKALRESIPSPRETLIPHLSPAQADALPYPSDLLPGARDVDTPFGTMRVYEWGPRAGRKVILIHGDTTPGPMLAPIAYALAIRGCRVMTYGTFFTGNSG